MKTESANSELLEEHRNDSLELSFVRKMLIYN